MICSRCKSEVHHICHMTGNGYCKKCDRWERKWKKYEEAKKEYMKKL